MKKQLWSLLLLVFAATATAQITQNAFSDLQYNGQGKLFYAKLEGSVNIGRDAAPAFIAELLGAPYGVNEVRSERDELGLTHIQYDIHFNGKPLAGRRVLAHFTNGRLGWINGDLQVSRSAEDAGFVLTEEQALAAAIAKIGATSYKWTNKAEETYMQKLLDDPSFTYYPHGKQVWFQKDNALHPAWQFNIYADEPLYRANVFVDAATGKILDEQHLLCNANATGTAVTKYSGTQTITCDQFSGGYRLRQTANGLGVETYNMKNSNNYSAASDFTNSTNSWTTTGFDQGAADAHWGAEMTHNYYLSSHNRNSINNMGMKLLSFVHYNNNYSNAFWDGQRMTYGDGNGGSMRIFTALDVCGHEITHGVNAWTANLVYSYESGALSESFSDIFGTAIENFARPTNWNWKIGEDITSNGNGLRSMQTPNSYSDPDTYKGSFWYGGSADNGGVHTNSGVPNFWFYLLTVGGNATNDLGNAYSVQGLGMSDAAKIAYRALTVYMTPNTDFAAARIACIQAARDLFGDCSNEMIQTANAWYAVGVGKQVSPTSVMPDFTTKVFSFCSVPASVSFSNTTPYAFSYAWDFGDGNSSGTLNPIHTYTAPGNYKVKLKATGCGGADSISKNAFITVNPPSTPVVAGSTVCYGRPASLVANGNGFIQWFPSFTSDSSMFTGNNMSIPQLTTTSTFYINNSFTTAPATGGLQYITGGTYLNNSTHYLQFDVHQNSTLNSVLVSANSPGIRVIELRNASNVVIQSKMVNLAQGTNTVVLDFALTTGTGYRLGLPTSGASDLYRTNIGVNYPYNVGGFVTLTGSSAGPGFYYYFYYWKVSRADCVSPKVAVTASVLPVTPVTLTSSSTLTCVGDVIPLNASPAGGVLTGPASQGTSFYPLVAGSHTLTYTYKNEHDCESSENIVLSAEACTGLSAHRGSAIALFPNPANAVATLTGLANGATVTLFDNTGRTMNVFRAESDTVRIDVTGYARGLYLISINKNGAASAPLRLVVE